MHIKDIKKPSLTIIGYVMISIILAIVFNNGLMLFMGWNMTLVGAAFWVGYVLTKKHQNMKHSLVIFGLIFWMLLYPNMMYMLTDTIHFQNTEFFILYPDVYHQDLFAWILFLQITAGIFIAAYLAMKSFDMIQGILKQRYQIGFKMTSITVFTLSSLGIYIGRFLRFNSWSILNPIQLIQTVIAQLDLFALGFIFIFIILHYLVYFLYHQHIYQP